MSLVETTTAAPSSIFQFVQPGSPNQSSVLGVQIEGGRYTAVDTGDGYFTVLGVPIMSEVPKGTKNAPFDIDRGYLIRCVAIAKRQYEQGKFCGPLHIGHNKPLELSDPDFAGYFLPRSVAEYDLNGDKKWTVFADLKLKAEIFERVTRGELPYVSPEINDWYSGKIDSVSLLNSKVPFFQYALFTIGEIRKDTSAKFEATFQSPYGMEAEMKKDSAHCDHCDRHEKAIMKFLPGAKMADEKPNATPVEPSQIGKEQTAMAAEAKIAAQFAAYEARIAALEVERKSREDETRVAGLIARAYAELKGYQLADSVKDKIAKFAKAGEEVLNTFVAAYKESVPKDPPKTLAEFEQGQVSDKAPELAKFQNLEPAELDKARAALAEWHEMKRKKWPVQASAEEYIQTQIKLTKGA